MTYAMDKVADAYKIALEKVAFVPLSAANSALLRSGGSLIAKAPKAVAPVAAAITHAAPAAAAPVGQMGQKVKGILGQARVAGGAL